MTCRGSVRITEQVQASKWAAGQVVPLKHHIMGLCQELLGT